MLAALLSSLLLLGAAPASAAEDLFAEAADDSDDLTMRQDATPRAWFYFNSSSTATALTLLGALILLGVIFYLVYVGGLLAPTPTSSNYAYNKNDYYYTGEDAHHQFGARYTGVVQYVH